MATQSCPNCGKSQDTSAFVSGQKLTCPACGLRFEVVRADVESLKAERLSRARGEGGAAFEAPADEGASTVISRAFRVPGYELVHVLGRGGMGEVWRARQVSLGREVAVKILAPELARDSDFVRRFEKESAALAALTHPHIVHIIDRGQAEGVYYFAMELVPGQSLRELMTERKLTPAEALGLITQVCHAIDYAHAHGVIHRDLKPENILVDGEGRVKVADFGLAGIRDDKLHITRTSMTMGTLSYMAPEQRKDAKNVDGRADLYSLGVMLYELLTGEVPVGRFKLPSEKVPGLDARIDAVVAKALEPEPEARQQRASQIGRELEALLPASELPAPLVSAGLTPVPASAAPALPTARPASDVASQVKRAGSALKRLSLGVLVFLGLASALSLAGFHWLNVDRTGIRVANVLEVKNPLYRLRDGGAEPALPGDTMGDVAVQSALQTRGGRTRFESALHPGSSASLIAFQGEWAVGPSGLTARVFDRCQEKGSRPRATLEEPAWRLGSLAAEVKVSVSPTPPAGYQPSEAPSATLLLHGDDLMLQLVMKLGKAPLYQLTWKYIDGSGKAVTEERGDPQLEQSIPRANEPILLKLVTQGDRLSVFVGGAPLFHNPIRVGDLLQNEVGRVGLGCEEGTCTFQDLRVEGEEVLHHDLGDDAHVHTMAAATHRPQ